MFRGRLRLIGNAGSIVWGYRPAVVVGPWSIAKVEGQMVLRGRLTRVDPFSARQKPLLFTAPRAGGFWAFPVVDLQVGPGTFIARVEPPVH